LEAQIEKHEAIVISNQGTTVRNLLHFSFNNTGFMPRLKKQASTSPQ
jgi:hypothetical protein